MWGFKVFTVFLLAWSVYSVTADTATLSFENLLKEVTADKEHHTLVNDIVNFVVNKIEDASKAVGANGVLDPVKLQEYVKNTLYMGTGWLAHKTGSLYSKIRDRVSLWWNNMQSKAATAEGSQEELSEELRKEVFKNIMEKIKEELRSRNITGIEEKDMEKFILPVVKKIFGDLFGFPVKVDEIQ